MDFKDRIGNDSGANRLEDALAWAATNSIHFLDFCADIGPNELGSWTDERVAAVKATCSEHDIHIGLHTLSGVNVGRALALPCRTPSTSTCTRTWIWRSAWNASGR